MQRILIALALMVLVACGADVEPEPSPTPSARITIEPVAAETASPSAPFSKEAWRKETIRRFGPEREFADGSRLDYVRVAEEICATEDRPDYEDGSLQDYMVETFCPHA